MNDPLEHLCEIAASFHARGYAFGSTGNLSIRTGDRVSITPTGQSLRALRPNNMAVIDLDGKPLNNNKVGTRHDASEAGNSSRTASTTRRRRRT